MALETSRGRTQRASSPRPRSEPQGEPTWVLPEGASFGPAHVLQADTEGTPLRLMLKDGRRVEAEWALPYRYLARPGDLLLVISRGERHYVLSVLHGRGRSQLAVLGNGALRAAGGVLRLRGDRGVRLESPRVTLRAQALKVMARVVHEKLGEVSTRIARRLFERAGASRRLIEEDDWHSAGTRTLVAEDSVLFNGDLIRIN